MLKLVYVVDCRGLFHKTLWIRKLQICSYGQILAVNLLVNWQNTVIYSKWPQITRKISFMEQAPVYVDLTKPLAIATLKNLCGSEDLIWRQFPNVSLLTVSDDGRIKFIIVPKLPQLFNRKIPSVNNDLA